MPTRMVGGFLKSLKDPDLVSVRKEMAVAEERIRDLIKRVDIKEAGELWRAMRRAVREFRLAQKRDDAPAAAKALREMESLADEGIADYAAWDEVAKWIMVSVRLKDTERRLLEAQQQSISVERALLFATNLLESVKRNVDDPRVLNAINADFARLVDRGAEDAPDGD